MAEQLRRDGSVAPRRAGGSVSDPAVAGRPLKCKAGGARRRARKRRSRWRMASRPRCRASSSATACPIGYAHAVETGLWAKRRPGGVPAGTWDVDLFRGTGGGRCQRHRRRGAGAADARRCSRPRWRWRARGLVSIRNETAARAYERAGFRWLHVLQRPAARAFLADAEGAAGAAASSLSWPAATSRRDTVSMPSPPAISSSVDCRRSRRSPCAARQASVATGGNRRPREGRLAAASWPMAWAMARRSY